MRPSPKRGGGPWRDRALATTLLLGTAFIGCSGSPEWTVVHRAPSGLTEGLGADDQDSVAALGREALEKLGYARIIELARKAGFVTTKKVARSARPARTSLAMSGAASAGEDKFIEVFSEYAVAAGVASQMDSPLPGPGDLVAVGILVIGLMHAGVLTAEEMGKARPPTASPQDAPEQRAEWSKYKACRDQYDADTKTCNALPDTDKALKNRCHDSASQRLGKCGKSKGKDLNSPPLIIH